MSTLAPLDYAVIGVFLALSLLAGLAGGRSAGRSMADFFLSGRSLPWWLAGISMAATNFSIDTPLAITRYVAQQGVAGVWFFWSNAISALLAAFLFSRLWRRSEVLTDAELIELRYSGPSAAGLRLFKGFYFGVFVNCYVLGWVLRAVIKFIAGVTDLPVGWTLGACVAVALVYTLASGLKGVVWTDFFQYGVGMAGSVVLAALALREVGGIGGLRAGLDAQYGSAEAMTRMIPPLGGHGIPAPDGMAWMPVHVLMVYLCVQWWAYKYSDGGGKHIQRMLACRSEGHAQGATVLFAAVNYAVQVWPWIITALCSLVLLGRLDDPEMGYPLLMARLLPAGLLGLVVVSMLSAFMSTVDTHLNLAASYMVNDVYRRFLRPEAPPRHYVAASRVAMGLVLAAAVATAWTIESVGDAWKFILAFISGAGVTWVLRWFWWRVNAWTEISAMVASGLVATGLSWWFPGLPYTTQLLWIVGLSTLVWLPVTLLTPPAAEETLRTFLVRVRPGSPGWSRVYRAHGLEGGRFLAEGVVDWLLGVVALFSFNFGVGKVLLGTATEGLALLAGAVAVGAGLAVRLSRRRWSTGDASSGVQAG